MTSLREVARFLRQENGLLDIKVEALRQDSLRYRQMAEHASKALDETRYIDWQKTGFSFVCTHSRYKNFSLLAYLNTIKLEYW